MKKQLPIWFLTLLLTFLLALPALAAELWQTDMAAAQAQAQKENKLMLLDFTGSDWCGWCKKLKAEVFDQELFQSQAPADFVLVELDFPQKTELPEELTRQNQALSKKFGISGFPSIVLTDARGLEFARTGYQAGGPEPYLKMLAGLVENYNKSLVLQKEAAGLKGLEKAAKLDQAVALLVANGSRGGYDQLAAEIIALDDDGKAGLRAKYELPAKIEAIEQRLNSDKDFDKAVADLDKLVAEAAAAPALLQQIHLFQAGILIKGKGDKENGIKKLELAQQADPESKTGQQLVKFIERLRQESEKTEKTD